MEKIKNFKSGDIIEGLLLVTQVLKGVADNGKDYLTITFQDSSGTLDAKKWDVNEKDYEVLIPGNVVKVNGVVNSYKNNLQLKVIAVEAAPDIKKEDYKEFARVSPIPFNELEKRLQDYLKSFKDKDVALIVKTIINHYYDKYTTYPAAVKIHHEFGSGILHHSIMMADLADYIAKTYPGVDRDLLVAGALIHDIGKVVEYENPLVPHVTKEGRLAGHISIFYAEFRKLIDPLNITSEVPLLLGHMILSHHGKLEFGSPVTPMTMEAMLLSLIDLIDSRVMVINKALENVKEGEFSQRLWALDDVSIYKPKKR